MKVLPVLLLILISIAPAFAIEAYISPVLIDDYDGVRVTDVVSVISKDKISGQNKRINFAGNKPAILSLYEVKDVLKGTGLESAVLIGKRPIYLPAHRNSEKEMQFYSNILNTIRKEFPNQEERLEIESNIGETAERFKAANEFVIKERNPWFLSIAAVDANTENMLITVEYTRKVPVTIARKYIRAGEPIYPEDISTRFVDILNVKDKNELFLWNGGEVFARTNISSGVLIRENNIGYKEMVKKGETVSIIVKRGSLKMRFSGRALEAAEVGNPVRVRPDRGRKELVGLLQDDNEVKVE